MTDGTTVSRGVATLGANGWEIVPAVPNDRTIILFGDSHMAQHHYSGGAITAAQLIGDTRVQISSTAHSLFVEQEVQINNLGPDYDGIQKVTSRIDSGNFTFDLARPPSASPVVVATSTCVCQARVMDRAWVQYANALKGHPYRLWRNCGRSGARTDQLLPAVYRDVVSQRPAVAVICIGQNDAIQGIADSVWQANMRRISQQIIDAGIELWWAEVPPINAASANYNAAGRQAILRMNSFIRQCVWRAKNARLIPLYQWVAVPTTDEYIAGYTGDDQHLNGKAAQKVGTNLAALAAFWPAPNSRRCVSTTDAKATDSASRQIAPQPLMQGSGGTFGGGATGTLPTGFIGTKTGAGATLTFGVATRADGFGQNATINFVSTANNDACDVTLSTPAGVAALVTAGDRLQFEGVLSLASLVNISAINFICEFFIDGVAYTISATNTSNSGTWGDDFTDLLLKSPEWTVPVTGAITAVQIRLKLIASGAGGCTGTYSQLSINILPPLNP